MAFPPTYSSYWSHPGQVKELIPRGWRNVLRSTTDEFSAVRAGVRHPWESAERGSENCCLFGLLKRARELLGIL